MGYEPNLGQVYWNCGRHWAVAFRCYKCGNVEYALFENCDMNLQCQKEPDGWSTHAGLLLCPSCTESFEKWWKDEL